VSRGKSSGFTLLFVALLPLTLLPLRDFQGLGRVATLACILGILLGVHLMLAILIVLCQNRIINQTLMGPDRMQLFLQWCLYAVVLCTFHLLEFFVTALYNPSVTSSDSFLINHSIAYTAAALVREMCDELFFSVF